MGRKIAVVGGGAAGMTAAIHAARLGAQVTIYERNDRIGRKILSTGNGKCNFSNEKMGSDCYYGTGAALVDALYEKAGVAQVKDFFQGLGMRLRSRNGYLYPASEQAATVLDGAGFVLAQKMGHRIIPTVPALVALRGREDFYKRVAGVRCDAGVTLRIDGRPIRSERGELQWTDYGISGIPVFQLSREAAYALQGKSRVTVEIDLIPDGAAAVSSGTYGDSMEGCLDEDKGFWQDRWDRQKNQTMDQFVTGLVNKKIGLLLLKLSGIRETDRAADIPAACREKLARLCRALPLEIKGTNTYEQAQVCAGGVDCSEVMQTLQSRLVPGLFFAGEILDIDGICGGYNLQWAWSSGIVAGQAAAGRKENGD